MMAEQQTTHGPLAEQGSTQRLALRFEYLPCINYSMLNSGVEACTLFVLENGDDHDWQHVTVCLTGDAIKDSVSHVDLLPQGRSIQLRRVHIVPDLQQLASTTESIETTFTLTITADDEVLHEQSYPLSLLAYDQWTGSEIMPELIASFVVPNSPLVPQVLVRAAKVLEQMSGSSTLDAYQTQSRHRVRQQVAAIYEALRSEGIVYCEPPADFERHGQRLRLADKVLSEKLGTCIDTTLLMASCLEQAGICPIIVMLQGHALVGAWLVPSVYPQMVCDDSSFLLKEMADGNHDVVLVETTSLTASAPVGFEAAVEAAAKRVRNDRDFRYFVDIRRCRLGNIKPLPQRVEQNGVWTFEPDSEETPVGSQVNSLSHYDLRLEDSGAPLTKQVVWERKLLDFTLRNNLLNARLGKRVVPFISFGIDRLEDHLQEGEDYQIMPCPDTKVEPSFHGMYDSQHQAAQHQTLVTELIQDNKLLSYMTDAELQDALKHLYRTARTALEENGANSLFLALGMLKWYETQKSEQPRFAPILLLPVDIIRKAGNHYIIRKRDEETIFNITLVELLKQTFNINLDPLVNLPTDQSGIDVKRVFTFIRRAIMEQKKWDVLEESMLGLFSFNKFVMWNDIHANADRLAENPVVAALMGKTAEQPKKADTVPADNVPDDELVDARKIDRECRPMDFAIPLDVDSSQMEAVVESGRGRSFILHGPPGTGKSQTITNMIANALFQGKRVLFVAEKMAALSVVQARLEKVGLAPFCLELHSNKVTKKHFLEQMDKVLNAKKINPPHDYSDTSQELYAERLELIAYMEALHQKGANGLSLYDCISEYLLIDEDEMEGATIDMSRVDASYISRLLAEAESTATILQITGQPSTHPLAGLEPADSRTATADELRTVFTEAVRLRDVRQRQYEALNDAAPFNVRNDADAEALAGIVGLMQSVSELNMSLLTVGDDTTLRRRLSDIVEQGQACEQHHTKLVTDYDSTVPDLDVAAKRAEWTAIQQQWFLPRFFKKKSFLKQLCTARRIGEDEVAPLLSDIEQYQRQQADYASQLPTLQDVFPHEARKGHEKWTVMTDQMEHAHQLSVALRAYCSHNGSRYPAFREALFERIGGDWETFRTDVSRLAGELTSTVDSLHEHFSRYKSLTQGGLRDQEDVLAHAEQWLGSFDKLRDWQHWVEKKHVLTDLGLGSVVSAIEQHATPSPLALLKAYAKAIYHRLISETIDANEQLRKFNGLLFRQQIENYKRNTRRFQELSKAELYSRLAARIPTASMASADGSEMGILKRNIANGGRGNSIRGIMDSIPTLLPRLCPCMLMSPLSVAQFLDLKSEKFDLVIFDEASQMPTSEAVGAIARGKALIVVGDSKQMPPTSFFTTSQVDEEEAELDDLESILDDCKTLSMHEYYLSWHYRSKHESLIAFSNMHYYGGHLLTFPSVDDQQVKVRMVRVEGRYDKGHTRSNPEEARAIVDEVLRRLEASAHPSPSAHHASPRSIGIVSFSKVQQNLIEDILNEALDKHPDLKDLATNSPEPIFIKNLENVQGDERDVILFSVGYGPDKYGKVSMNFGPLNNVGGERRLNVAVSRARYEMIVFSTMSSAQIDLRRSNAKGVEGLKAFLEYAESGRLPLLNNVAAERENHILVAQICDAIEQMGYRVTPAVGRSSFKVDIAVSTADTPDSYILGILCDGRNYYETKTTRDREIVQPTVLQMLQWRIMRVYSVDWYEHHDRTFKQILDQLKEAESAPPMQYEEPKPTFTFTSASLKTQRSARTPKRDQMRTDYVEADVKQLPIHKSNYQSRHTYNKNIMRQILEVEQPVTEAYIAKRLARALGFAQLNTKVKEAVELYSQQFYRTPMLGGRGYCLWLNESAAAAYHSYRSPSARTIQEIPDAEIANVIIEVVSEEFSLPRTSVPKLTAKKLGFANTGPKMSELILAVLSDLQQKGRVNDNNGFISISETTTNT